MTPLEQAQRQKKYGCDTCGKRVVVRGVSYCEVSGKLLLPSLLDVGQCMHVPSEGEPKGDGMETRENELHEPKIEAFEAHFAEFSVHPVGQTLYQVRYDCPVCGKGAAQLEMGKSEEQAIERFRSGMDNYCPNCGSRLKEVEK